jgi:hypothetical protein
MLSIILLQDEFLLKLMAAATNESNQEEQNQVKIDDERLAVLAIAYHNMGVEFEHLKRFE